MVILFMHATCLMIAMYHDDQNRAVGVVAYDDSPEVPSQAPLQTDNSFLYVQLKGLLFQSSFQ